MTFKNSLLVALILFVLGCTKDSDTSTPAPTAKPKFTITVSAGTGGSVSSPGGSYEQGASFSVTATPNTGYAFVNWSDGDTANPKKITVSTNLTLMANFELLDADQDGILNEADQCPDTPANTPVDDFGCASPIYLDANGVTIKATDWAQIGDKATINGVEYEVVSLEQLAQRIQNGADLTTACTSKITNMDELFRSITTINGELSGWDVSNVTSMSQLFSRSSFSGDLSKWDVSKVTNMTSLFFETNFNGDISNWDVSSVTTMRSMFATSQFNGDISGWNVSNVTATHYMFAQSVFNSDISEWDMSHVTEMQFMFAQTPFNQNIGGWNVSAATNMQGMFALNTAFNQDLSAWQIENVTVCLEFDLNTTSWVLPKPDLSCIAKDSDSDGVMDEFDQEPDTYPGNTVDENGKSVIYLAENGVTVICPNSKQFDVATINGRKFMDPGGTGGTIVYSYWLNNDLCPCTTKLGGIRQMITQNINTQENYKKLAIETWDTSSETNFSGLFKNFNGFNEDLSYWNTSGVTDMSTMLRGTSNFSATISTWDVSNVSNMNAMLQDATGINVDLSNWNVSSLVNASYLFEASDFNIDISRWDVSNVQDMSWMFANSSFNMSIGNWNTSSVQNMSNMFSGSPFNQPIGNWNTSKVAYFTGMFDSTSFNQPIGNWNVSSAAGMIKMFYNSNFNQNIGNWDVSNVSQFQFMFEKNSVFNQNISNWAVTGNIDHMFFSATSFNQDLSSWCPTSEHLAYYDTPSWVLPKPSCSR